MPSAAVILSNPQMGENIGAAARGMLNFGLRDLRLVAPRDGWPNVRALDMAAGALDDAGGDAGDDTGERVQVSVFENMHDALQDLSFVYATTARTRDMVKPVFTPHSAAADARARSDAQHRVGFVFGGERSGLSNDELALCSAIIKIPTNPDFSSLNLGQAVLLVAHDFFQAGDDTNARVMDMGNSAPAPQGEVANFLGRLEGALEDQGFFKSEGWKPTMIRNIRNIFTRSELSAQEVNTLQGVVSALRGRRTNT
jgi:tRNA/rRNA methyltransferase